MEVEGSLGEYDITEARGGENFKKEGVFILVQCCYRHIKEDKDLKMLSDIIIRTLLGS